MASQSYLLMSSGNRVRVEEPAEDVRGKVTGNGAEFVELAGPEVKVLVRASEVIAIEQGEGSKMRAIISLEPS